MICMLLETIVFNVKPYDNLAFYYKLVYPELSMM